MDLWIIICEIFNSVLIEHILSAPGGDREIRFALKVSQHFYSRDGRKLCYMGEKQFSRHEKKKGYSQ